QVQRTTRESALQIATTTAGVVASGGGFSIRGSRNTDTQVRIDGQEITDMVSGGIGAAAARTGSAEYAPTASAFATEEVQVLRSNFGAQYGNATGGVVNQTVKTGRTDSYEGYLRYRTDVPFLFGRNSSNGAKALAGMENTYEFGVGGPLPIISGSTFFLSTRYFHERYRANGLDVRDRGGNSLGQIDNNTSQVRNITGRMTFQLSDKIKTTLGGSWGLTTLAQGGWDWMYARNPAMTFARNPQTGLNDTTILSTVPENIAKTNVMNNFIYSYFFRLNHQLTDVSFYEATVSYNNNITEDARRVIDLGTGSAFRNGQIVDPSRVTTSARGPGFFTGYDLMIPKDEFTVSTSGLQPATNRDAVTGKLIGDKVVDFYSETPGTVIRDGRANDPEAVFNGALVPNPLTGYVEGGEDVSSTTNPYGLRRIFSARGNNDGGGRGRGFEFRMADAIQFETNFQTQIETSGGTKHLIRTGIDGRYYFVHRYSNSLPWTGNPFYDVYTDMYGGDIYSQSSEEQAAGSKPKNAAMVALYAEDQIQF
ncbi:MAG: TonB-dependent receptor plug domain-containing protein, partial [Candidatus Kapabacteria bacterium]|nr:TonB-dependent receptor plug domain-containing protein [Candidatus Kapabacteria bacterium]